MAPLATNPSPGPRDSGARFASPLLGGGRVDRDRPRRVEPARDLAERSLELSQHVDDTAKGLGDRHPLAAQRVEVALERAEVAAKLAELAAEPLTLVLLRLERVAQAIQARNGGTRVASPSR